MKLLEKLNEYFEKLHKESKGSGKFKISHAGLCPLFRILQRKGVEITDKPTVFQIRRTELGKIIHEYYQKIFKDMGILIASEEWLEDEHRIGRFDALLEIDGKKVLIDIKTTSTLDLSKLLQKHNYFMQVATYKEMLESQGEKIDEMGILFVDTKTMQELYVPVSQEYEIKAKEDWQNLINIWNEGQLPKPKENEFCKFCPYRSLCFSS